MAKYFVTTISNAVNHITYSVEAKSEREATQKFEDREAADFDQLDGVEFLSCNLKYFAEELATIEAADQ